jgi:hypothetical protein
MGIRPPASGNCHVPDCGKPAELYPAGWLCEDHKPQHGRQLEVKEKEKAK